MTLYVLDSEGDNLRPKAKHLWCITIQNPVSGGLISFYNGDRINREDLYLIDFPDYVQGSFFIMHNGVQYDRWLINKILGIDIQIDHIIDTLILSKMLYPDLKVPQGWQGKPKPHSVEAWAMRLGMHKPEHEDWSHFSPEMLNRNQWDVKIQTAMYRHFIEEIKKL